MKKRIIFAIQLRTPEFGTGSTMPTQSIYLQSDYEVTQVDVYEGKKGEEILVRSYEVERVV